MMQKENISPEKIEGFSPDGKDRYAIGEIDIENNSAKTLIYIGRNPGTGTLDNLDPTMKKFLAFCKNKEYDTWLMINIYPQIGALQNEIDENKHKKNKEKIKNYFEKYFRDNPNVEILCCWDFKVDDLVRYLCEIYEEILKNYKLKFLSRDGSNPIAPALPGFPNIACELQSFDIVKYIDERSRYG